MSKKETITDNFDLAAALKELEEINAWFENAELDLNEALVKFKRGQELVKLSKNRLQEVENEFVSLKREFEEETE